MYWGICPACGIVLYCFARGQPPGVHPARTATRSYAPVAVRARRFWRSLPAAACGPCPGAPAGGDDAHAACRRASVCHRAREGCCANPLRRAICICRTSWPCSSRARPRTGRRTGRCRRPGRRTSRGRLRRVCRAVQAPRRPGAVGAALEDKAGRTRHCCWSCGWSAASGTSSQIYLRARIGLPSHDTGAPLAGHDHGVS